MANKKKPNVHNLKKKLKREKTEAWLAKHPDSNLALKIKDKEKRIAK